MVWSRQRQQGRGCLAFPISERKDSLKPSPANQVREPTHRFGTSVPAMYNIGHLPLMFCPFMVATGNRTDSEIQGSSAWIHCTRIKRSNDNCERLP